MRSILGVGITPPKVLGAPKPWSSVMMSNTLGAPLGGTIRGAHQAFESEAFCSITPPKSGGGGGICFPSMVAVAPGEPGVPVTYCAEIEPQPSATKLTVTSALQLNFMSANFRSDRSCRGRTGRERRP